MATPNVSSPASYPQSTTEVSQRVALYGRVSTKDKGQEVQNQLRQLREFAAHSGWTIVAEFVDHESGKVSDREQFQAMFNAASKRQFDVLLFWSLDRLSREGVLPTLQHLQRLTSYGMGFRSYTEQYFDSCGIFRDAVIAIIATVAKQERIRISERVRAGLSTARNKGKRLGRPKVFVSRARIESLRHEGLSWREIAQQLGSNTATVRRAYAVQAPALE
jgi:DNA invertase Pin-like site-specific DNA recombinase